VLSAKRGITLNLAAPSLAEESHRSPDEDKIRLACDCGSMLVASFLAPAHSRHAVRKERLLQLTHQRGTGHHTADQKSQVNAK
jgi:hypothetical protein